MLASILGIENEDYFGSYSDTPKKGIDVHSVPRCV